MGIQSQVILQLRFNESDNYIGAKYIQRDVTFNFTSRSCMRGNKAELRSHRSTFSSVAPPQLRRGFSLVTTQRGTEEHGRMWGRGRWRERRRGVGAGARISYYTHQGGPSKTGRESNSAPLSLYPEPVLTLHFLRSPDVQPPRQYSLRTAYKG